MAIFPPLRPSSPRTRSLADYPLNLHAGAGGEVTACRLSAGRGREPLPLDFLGLSSSDLLSIWTHYLGQGGALRSFALSAEVLESLTPLGGGALGLPDPASYTPVGFSWIYAPGSAIRVEDIPGTADRHDVSLLLLMVPEYAGESTPTSGTPGSGGTGGYGSSAVAIVVFPQVLADGASSTAGGGSAVDVEATPAVVAGGASGESIGDAAVVVVVPIVAAAVVDVLVAPRVLVGGTVLAPAAVVSISGIAPSVTVHAVPAAAAVVSVTAPSPAATPEPTIRPGVYSQVSVWVDNTAATSAGMTNGISAETTETGTDAHTTGDLAWVQVDHGSEVPFSSVVVGTDFDNTLAGGWGQTYTDNSAIIGSNNGTDWTTIVADIGVFSQGIQEYATPGASYRYVRIRRSGYLAVTEFYAKG